MAHAAQVHAMKIRAIIASGHRGHKLCRGEGSVLILGHYRGERYLPSSHTKRDSGTMGLPRGDIFAGGRRIWDAESDTGAAGG